METYSLLLEELAQVGISTQHALEVFVREHLEDAIKEGAVEAKRHRDRLLKSGKPLPPKQEQGIYFMHTGLVRVMLRAVYPEQMKELCAAWRRRRDQKAT